MTNECVVAVYPSFEKARLAIQALDQADYPAEQVSLVTHSVQGEVPRDETLQYGDKTERNAATGAGIGGLVGVLLGSPLLTVGGIGAVLIAGPIAVGLTGALVGGFLGAMSGWGVHTDHVLDYEKKVAEGAILVVVNGNPQQVAEAEGILQEADADELHRHSESSADSVDP